MSAAADQRSYYGFTAGVYQLVFEWLEKTPEYAKRPFDQVTYHERADPHQCFDEMPKVSCKRASKIRAGVDIARGHQRAASGISRAR
jgi:hypothetical protein